MLTIQEPILILLDLVLETRIIYFCTFIQEDIPEFVILFLIPKNISKNQDICYVA